MNTPEPAAEPAAGPRYLKIRRALESAIISGEWPPGHRLPSEPDLARRFGCARMTVGRAVGALVDAGLLTRRRRAGTFVARRRVEETVLAIHDIAAEVRAGGGDYRFERLARRARSATAAEADRLGVEPGRPVLAVRGVHRADGTPLAVEERLIDLLTVPAAREEPFLETAPGSWLLAHVPWTEAEHQIEAVEAGQAGALLGVPATSPCLRIERRTWRGDALVTWVRLTYPAGRRQLVGRFRMGDDRRSAGAR